MTASLPGHFDAVLASEGIEVRKISPRSPNCNPHAERFVRSAREEVLDNVLIFDRGHVAKISTSMGPPSPSSPPAVGAR